MQDAEEREGRFRRRSPAERANRTAAGALIEAGPCLSTPEKQTRGYMTTRRLAIAIVVIVMFLAAVIVNGEPAVVVASCWPNKAMLAIAIASGSVGCCLGVVTGLFAGGGVHDR